MNEAVTTTIPSDECVTSQKIGQEWRKCPYMWGISELVTVDSNIGKLVLCDIHEVTTSHTQRFAAVPVLAAELPNMEPMP